MFLFSIKTPEMNALGVADAVIEKLREEDTSFLFANFANIDVLGHIENIPAIQTAVETVDLQMGRCLEEARRQGVVTIVTADHGAAEKWFYPDGTVDTGHTNSPVPFAVAFPDQKAPSFRLRLDGELADVAPTILEIMGLPKPEAMTGKSLLVNAPPFEKKGSSFSFSMDGATGKSPTETSLPRRRRRSWIRFGGDTHSPP